MLVTPTFIHQVIEAKAAPENAMFPGVPPWFSRGSRRMDKANPLAWGTRLGGPGASRARGHLGSMLVGSGRDKSRRPGLRQQKCVSPSSGGRKFETRVRGSPSSWLADELLAMPSRGGERGSPVSPPVWVLVPSQSPMALGPPKRLCHPAGLGLHAGILRAHPAPSRFSAWALRMSAHPSARN